MTDLACYRTTPDGERFYSKLAVSADGCWVWTASLNPAGYGVFGVGGKTTFLAHRWSYEFMVGPIPDGLQIDHLCRVKSCVRPDHLEAVTSQENMRRVRRSHCKRGHEFTEQNAIRKIDGRECRTCQTERAKKRWAKKLEARTDRIEASP